MIPYVLVFLGGGLGSICRYGIAHLMSTWRLHFPLATLTANVVSCLLLGILAGLSLRELMPEHYKYLLMVGFCGGFSTFSTFTNENFALFQSGHAGLAMLNIGGSLLLCLACVFIGIRLVF
ncbi:MAG: fluoride efflux transporter CrcB [Phaeodactylibacter sp.]|nr:fluoride efflux transporter CrcB [Phaeodactylibacter sp.]MCB9275063.1 fluoride efflux transporter CrcB [Lewinellaceae bacterium]